MSRKIFYIFFLSLLAVSVSGRETPAQGEQKIKVAATSALFADLVKQIGQSRVEVKTIASPKFNIHFYAPKPSDVKAVRLADLYVSSGLDLEAWSDPLLEAAGNPKLFRGQERYVDMSAGIELLNVPQGKISRAEGDIHLFGNPHYVMDPKNAGIMAEHIADQLKAMDSSHADIYEKNLQVFLNTLADKIKEWKDICRHCEGKEIISYHNDIVYFARFLGVKSERFLQPKPGIPPTAKHLEELVEYAKNNQVKAVVLPTYYNRSAAEKLADRIGGKVVVVCQNVGEKEKTEDFFSFFDYNVGQLSEAFK